ncbi:MAG: zinc ribbon domain-containing protein [Eubacteriaceae bacterium]|nr:zinc ribbon domain-containing protein [Eubacteriaceae bacterium]
MLYCKHCGKKLDKGSPYCPFCGEKIEHSIQEEMYEDYGRAFGDFSESDIENNRFAAALAYIGPVFLFGLYNKESSYVRFHAYQSMSILLALLGYTAFYVCGILVCVFSRSRAVAVFAAVGGIAYIFFAIMYAVGIARAVSGNPSGNPFFGRKKDW